MSKNYWAERTAAAQEKLTDKNIKKTDKQIRKYYADAMASVIDSFEATYDKLLATSEDPSPATLYNLERYWKLQGQLRQQLEKLGNRQASMLGKLFEIQFFDIYYSFALPSGKEFASIDKSMVQQMINHIWCADGKSWSSRIWDNTSKLQQALNDKLIECVLTGKKTTELKHLLQEQFNASYNRADALVRTEMAHIQTQAAQKRYQDYGIREVEVLVDKDSRTCPICAKHEGERYLVNATMPVPFHPRCRCCMVPVIDD